MSEIGMKIREIRAAKGLTIKDVSKKTSLSNGFISRMERGDISPSLSSVKKIADALDISVGDLFDKDDAKPGEKASAEIKIVRKKERRKLVYPDQQAYDYLLTPSIQNVGIEFILTVLEPGGSSGKELYTHEGEECILVNKGTLQLYIGDDRFELFEGDSIHFKSSIPHRYENTSSTTLEAVWVVVPPTF